MSVEIVLSFLLLGSLVGLMAGLLGIGGGGILVPILTAIFINQSIPLDKVLHLALGTSMTCIVLTSFFSLRAHQKKSAVIWRVVKWMSLGVIIGTFCTTFFVTKISTETLAIFFACFMAYVAIQMLFNFKAKTSIYKEPNHTEHIRQPELLLVSLFIGAISALVSIGGGSLTVPYLSWRGINVRLAIGTSAAIGFPLSVAGSLGYLINGWSSVVFAPYSVGYIYLPAVIFISLATFFTVPLGAHLTHQLPVPILKKIFALLLITLSIKMLWSLHIFKF